MGRARGSGNVFDAVIGRASGIPTPIMPTENIDMISGAIRKKREGGRRDERGSRRGRRFSKVTQFDGSTKVDTGKILTQAEYEADATRQINEMKKKGIQVSPMPYSMYLERQQPGYKEKQAAAIKKENELRMKLGGSDVASEIQKENELRRRFDSSRPSAVQETTRVNVQDPTLGGRPEREVPIPKEKDMTPRGPAPFAPNEGEVAKQRFFETMFERAANRKERSGIDKGEMRDRQEARRDEAMMRDSEMGGRRRGRRDFTRRRPERRRSREERAAFRDRYVSTLGGNFFS